MSHMESDRDRDTFRNLERRLSESQGMIQIDVLIARPCHGFEGSMVQKAFDNPSLLERQKAALDSPLSPSNIFGALAGGSNREVLQAIAVIDEWMNLEENLWDEIPFKEAIAIVRRLIALSDRHEDSEVRENAAGTAKLMLDQRKSR